MKKMSVAKKKIVEEFSVKQGIEEYEKEQLKEDVKKLEKQIIELNKIISELREKINHEYTTVSDIINYLGLSRK